MVSPEGAFDQPVRPVQIAMKATTSRAAGRSHTGAFRGLSEVALCSVLRGFYGWYRETAPMAENVQRDRGAVPALDVLMQRTADARLDQLTETLAMGFRDAPGRAS